MKTFVGLLLFFVAVPVFGTGEDIGGSQGVHEKGINAIVRNKLYYKQGRIEVGGHAGVMPYDSLINHFMAGSRLTWHLSDYLGWEIIDAQLAFPTLTSFSTGLVQDKGISRMETLKLKTMIGSHILFSPLYGKMRLFGKAILWLDIYLIGGVGFNNTDVVQLSSTGTGVAGTESTVRTTWDPSLNFGLGFKIFLNDAMGLVLDFRDYIVMTELYGERSLKSNFTVSAGLSFFLPTF